MSVLAFPYFFKELIMNSLRIEKKNIYTIEVNDNGETIEFDLGDIELPFKLQRAYDGIKNAQTQLKGKIAIIEKQQDRKDNKHLLSKNEEELLKAWKKAFIDMRKAMDEFLGEGGCQKIFGDSNYLEMFDDLFDELSKPQEDGLSHLDKMQISRDGLIDRIKSKYAVKSNNTI